MRAIDAQQRLALSPEQFGAQVLSWLEEMKLHPTKLVVLEEKLSAEALAVRWHISEDTATRIIRAVNGRRKLSRKLLRAPASALEAFFVNKTLPAKKRA